MTTLPAIPEEAANYLVQAAQDEGSNELGKLLKFNKGHYYIGDDEVPLGREYIAHINQWLRGWIKFEDGKPVDKRIGLATDGFKVPEREELGDTDEIQWAPDTSGTRRDPWSRQSYLPLEDVETGEVVIFVTGSHGGRGAVSKLADTAGKNHRNGLPQIQLGRSSYSHKTYGRIEKPEFPVVKWTGVGASKPKPLKEELSDEIPF